MAKARKEGKPKRNRANLLKNIKRMKNNNIFLSKLKGEMKKEGQV